MVEAMSIANAVVSWEYDLSQVSSHHSVLKGRSDKITKPFL